MAASLVDLPPELQEQIFNYCYVKDLLNVSCCNQAYFECVKPFLWVQVRIPNDQLYNEDMLKHKTKHARFTRHLHFKGGVWINHTEQGIMNFINFIRDCDQRQVKSIHFDRFILPGTLIMTSLTLSGITELIFTGIRKTYYNIDMSQFQMLSKFRMLKKLELVSCDVNNPNIKSISKLQSLQDLVVSRCTKLSRYCLTYISRVPKLKTLQFSNNFSFSTYPKYFNGLAHLKELNLSESCVKDKFFANACLVLRNLSRLDIRSCTKVNNTVLLYISSMTSLQSLFINECRAVSDVGVSFLTNLILLKELDISCTHVTDNSMNYISKLDRLEKLVLDSCYLITDLGLSHLSKLPSLKLLNVHNLIKITDEGLNQFANRLSIYH